ncbi:MAG: hypothetical protein Q8N13_22395 [Acidovorax sp.]|nr:hypothetical protein [Acidovorax sp.]
MDPVASIQAAIGTVGKLRELAKKIEEADFRMLLADLSNDLADAKVEAAELKTRLAQALEDNTRLEKQLNTRQSATPQLQQGAYAFEGQEGLFCTACFDAHDKKIRVTPLTGPFRTFGKWSCPVCNANLG